MSPVNILEGDCRETLREIPDGSVHCCVTSPPYFGLRDYGASGQIGLEARVEDYVAELVGVFAEVRRTLHERGTLWLNMGDSYSSGGRAAYDVASFNKGNGKPPETRPDCGKPKDILMIPARVALALQADGWWLRSEIIWAKGLSFCDSYSGSVMPESCRDRPTSAHEKVFLLAKSPRYFADMEAVRERISDANAQRTTGHYETSSRYGAQNGGNGGLDALARRMRQNGHSGRNVRNVWAINPQPTPEAHFATMPEKLVEKCLLIGTSPEGCCPRCGAFWERVVERETVRRERPADKTTRHEQGHGVNSCGNTVAGVATTTTGWSPSCDCGEPTTPCTVLDPFAGSGTTLAVARRLGMNAIGCELNPDYCEMIRKRFKQRRLW